MQDMLVKLYDLPDIPPEKKVLRDEGYIFKHPIAPELSILSEWVEKNFSEFWGAEMKAALSHLPTTAIVCLYEDQPVGFACYDTTCKGFFGPTGVLPEFRGKGIGKILLIESLMALKNRGYAYAIIGGVGPVEYYQKTVNATIIEGSNPGIYHNLIRRKSP